MAKFVNSNFKEGGLEILLRSTLLSTFLQIVSKRENYSLRERIMKENFLKNYLFRTSNQSRYPLNEDGKHYDDKFVLGINLIHIFSKFHP